MDLEQRRRIYSQESSSLSDEDLLAILTEDYQRDDPPPCRVCGGPLGIASAGGGNASVWACDGMEDNPDQPGRLRWKEGRKPADDHYAASRWTQYRAGDQHVLELIARYLKARGVGGPSST
jgi:hypothetical protein